MIANYVARWSQAQQEQLQLCEKIDQIAGRLPLYDVDALNQISKQLTDTLVRLHGFEEGDLFPVLEAMSPPIKPLLVTFRTHHARDRITAKTIADALQSKAAQTVEGLRELRFHLQACAEMIRRHVQFEEAITMALFASKRVDERRSVQ